MKRKLTPSCVVDVAASTTFEELCAKLKEIGAKWIIVPKGTSMEPHQSYIMDTMYGPLFAWAEVEPKKLEWVDEPSKEKKVLSVWDLEDRYSYLIGNGARHKLR